MEGSIPSTGIYFMNNWHILPRNDIKSHIESGVYCHCRPNIAHQEGSSIVIHNAYDAREFFEDETIFELFNPIIITSIVSSLEN